VYKTQGNLLVVLVLACDL